MANTPQAKKRIRRNATRQTINHSRVEPNPDLHQGRRVGDRVGQEG